jgi:hypothetical protein
MSRRSTLRRGAVIEVSGLRIQRSVRGHHGRACGVDAGAQTYYPVIAEDIARGCVTSPTLSLACRWHHWQVISREVSAILATPPWNDDAQADDGKPAEVTHG